MSQKSILITGCSSGIGLDAALAFRDAGWLVIASCRTEADCKTMRAAHNLLSLRIDYEDEASIITGFTAAMEMTGGTLDVAFNNGAYAIPALVEDLPTAALRAIFEANFFGWHTLTRLAIAQMRTQGHGRIIQNSSVLGFAPLKLRGAYVATKFALEGLTDTMRLELNHTGIHFILIEPGPIRTKIRENAFIQFKRWIDWKSAVRASWYENVVIPRLAALDPPADWFELMPDAVTRAVMHAATASRPKLRYRITLGTKIMMVMRRLLSSRAYDALARRL
jgi:NAD(P)-dependent dehydrogenase (short-subunit alcohol dehydrogenase family)